jgi:hypothetical protein
MTDYYVLVAGSRGITNRLLVDNFLDDCLTIALTKRFMRLVVRHGECPTGPDKFADDWVKAMKRIGLPVEADPHPAQDHPTQDFGPWPGAGPRRNAFMVGLPTHECVAFIGPCTSLRCRRPGPHPSHGASGCADLAEKAGIQTTRVELWQEF